MSAFGKVGIHWPEPSLRESAWKLAYCWYSAKQVRWGHGISAFISALASLHVTYSVYLYRASLRDPASKTLTNEQCLVLLPFP